LHGQYKYITWLQWSRERTMPDAFIFDLDGLLIDSEPLWQEAEITVFATVGVALTRDMCRQTMGLRVDAAIAHWYARFPWEGPTPEQVKQAVLAEVRRLIVARGCILPGVRQALDLTRASGARLALASSSPLALIETAIQQLGIAPYFDVVHSAEFEAFGKPHPAVYLSAARLLGVDPHRCVALEDSINGVIAAKAAGMRCIAVPERSALEDRRFGVADLVLASLEHLDAATLAGL
jgi:sugar-phosphatase